MELAQALADTVTVILNEDPWKVALAGLAIIFGLPILVTVGMCLWILIFERSRDETIPIIPDSLLSEKQGPERRTTRRSRRPPL